MMKEKLMLLLHTSGWNIFTNPVSQNIEQIADYLIECGVIVPPCKVGATVWVIHFDKIYPQKIKSVEANIYGCFVHSLSMTFSFKEFGKTVFLTREKAEQALQKRGAGNAKM